MGETDIPTLQDAWDPREDVLQGKIRDESLAADAHEVAYGNNVPDVYDDTETFFDLTYPTSGVTGVIEAVAQRVIAHYRGEFPEENGTITLDTSFGGGKTHSQIAAYHLAEHSDEIPDLTRYTQSDETAHEYRALENNKSVLTSVFVGTKYAPKPVKPKQVRQGEHTPEIQTIWGHIAYQLYGVEGYQVVSSGNNLVAPGEQLLSNLFSLSDEAAVIIMDEIAAHLSHATAVSVNDGNLAEQTLNFLMALFNYASNNSDVTVIMSVAADAFEDFATIFERDLSYDDEVMDADVSIPIAKETIQEFQNIEERVANKITPVEDSNVADVLRNRLFKNNIETGLREDIAQRYYDFYDADSSSFPDEASQPEARERIEQTYPFHPTVVDTLTKQIDAVPSFQKARGALKLLAPAVMRLWTDEGQGPLTADRELIRLYDLHPQDERTSKMLKSIFGDIEMDFEPAVKDDIYNTDPNDTPNALYEDKYWINRGQPPLGTRVVTTTIWKSLVKGAGSKGTSRDYIRYASAKPGETIDHYNSAIGNLLGESDESACFYLHGENNQQLKFKTIVTVEKAINQANPRTSRVDNLLDETLYNAALGGSSMTIYENPQAVHEVDDTIETLGQLVVVEPSTLTISEPDDITETVVTKIYERSASSKHGNKKPRTYKNNLIFLVPGIRISRARSKAGRLASVRVVQDNPDDFGLQDAQLDELPTKRDEARGDLENLVKNAYSHVYIPNNPSPDQPHEGLAHYNITVTDSTLINAVIAKLEDSGEVITNNEPAYSPNWLENNLWMAVGDSMTTVELKQQIGKQRSAEILLDPRPLQKTIRRAIRESDSKFAYWNHHHERGYVDPSAFEEIFDERNEAVTFDEAHNLVAAEELEDVGIDSSEEVYESTKTLIESVAVTWQCSDCGDYLDSTREYAEHSCQIEIECGQCPDTFSTQQEYEQHLPCGTNYDCSNCGRTFNTEESLTEHQPCPWPQTVVGKTDSPAVVTEAVDTITAEIEDKVTQIKHNFNSSTHEIKQSLDGLTLKLQGDDAWKKGEWIAKQMPEQDGLQNVAVELEYEARYDDSHVETHFDGTGKMFADTLKHTNKPSGSPDDQYIEILIKADTSLELNRLDILEDIIPGATTIEMSVRTALELTEDEKREMTP